MQKMTFNFQNFEITTMTNDHQEVWFLVNSVAMALGYSQTNLAVRMLDDDEVWQVPLSLDGQTRKYSVISESGLYHLIIKSRKPEAKKFRKWVTSQVLPSIRKTGSYGPDPISQQMKSLQELTWKKEEKQAQISELNRQLTILRGELTDIDAEFWKVFKANPNQLKLPFDNDPHHN